jgi:hypothetical protein
VVAKVLSHLGAAGARGGAVLVHIQ